MKKSALDDLGFLARLVLCGVVFLAFTGFSGTFVTHVSGSVSSSVRFSFYDGPNASHPASMQIARFGVEKSVPNGGWVPVWEISELPKLDTLVYGTPSVGKEVVPPSHLQPGITYRSYAAAFSAFGPTRYSNIVFKISQAGDVVPP